MEHSMKCYYEILWYTISSQQQNKWIITQSLDWPKEEEKLIFYKNLII
jgi:hypothetical protein